MSHSTHEMPVCARQPITTGCLQEGAFEKQYAALCYRRHGGDPGGIQVLLITSRDTGRWIIPKGWPEKKLNSYEVARLEAWEEAGVKGRVHKKALGYYAYLKKLDNNELVAAKVQVHLLDVCEQFDDFPEHDQRQLCWFTPEAAASLVREPELKTLMLRLGEMARVRDAVVKGRHGRTWELGGEV